MFHGVERRLCEVAARKRLAVLLVGCLPLLLRAVAWPWVPAPNPRVQDEFSHLLVADTLAHGRLVNPVHPMWVHFESMHILVRPVYASVFPVAQGAALAAGQALTGDAWSGVWIGVGLMCAALCWMLQGWVSPGWALLGGVVAAVRFGVFSYWMNSFYGGAVAAAGGALVLGALPRLARSRKWADAALMAVGLAILANARPFEGAVFSLPIAAAAVWLLRVRGRGFAFLVPAALILTAAAAALGYYCARFSGNPLLLPYSLYRNTETLAPHFVWQAPRPEPAYHHRVVRDFHVHWEMGAYEAARENRSPYGVFDKVKTYWRFYLGPFLSLPFLSVPWLWRRRRTRFLLLAAIWFSAGLALEVWSAPHYAAPAAGLIVLLVIEALRHVRQGAGTWVVRAVVAASLLSPVVGGNGVLGSGAERARILRQLESDGGRHLVIVRYAREHDPGEEWVYNSAGIDGAAVVWAREMDPDSNRELVSFFHDRRAWLVRPDVKPVTLAAYDPSIPPDPPFRFVRLGEDAIAAIRSPEEIRRKILLKVSAGYAPPYRFNCDQWNYFFTQVTGIEPPDPADGYLSAGSRAQSVSFDEWFAWVKTQR